MHLLDSSALIEILKNTAKGKKIIDFIGSELALTSSFSIHELLLGANETDKENIFNFLERIDIFNYDEKAAIRSAEIEIKLSKKGTKINKTDLFIAGICLSNNTGIITLDKDFKKINELKTEIF